MPGRLFKNLLVRIRNSKPGDCRLPNAGCRLLISIKNRKSKIENWKLVCLSVLFILSIQQSILWANESTQKHSVYVGVKVCASCHQGEGMGHQFSKWLASRHAQAYAVLSKPEAKKIAELSGIPQEPQESAMCLGCHNVRNATVLAANI